MHYYFLYQQIIKSDIELPVLLPSGNQSKYDIEITYGTIPDFLKQELDSEKGLGFGPQICWLNTAYGLFLIQNAKEIIVVPSKQAADWELRPFILGFCMATIFIQRNMLAFHCSSISLQNSALIFSGYSGSGKSTTLATFLKHGASMIADDMAVLSKEADGYYALPAYPQHKLCGDAALRQGYDIHALHLVNEERDKYAISCIQNFCKQPQRITAFFLLEVSNEVDKVHIELIPPNNALKTISDNLFLSITLRITKIPEYYLLQCISFVQDVPVYKITRPQNTLDTSEEIYQQILSLLN